MSDRNCSGEENRLIVRIERLESQVEEIERIVREILQLVRELDEDDCR